MNCLFCKGSLEPKPTTFLADLDNCIVIVKNVPSDVCRQFGEVYYNDEIMGKLEKIVDKMRDTVTEVAITNFANKTA